METEKKKKERALLIIERLKEEYFYPIFLKKEIYNLPSELTIRTEFE